MKTALGLSEPPLVADNLGLSLNLLNKGSSFHPPGPAPGLCEQVLGDSLLVPCPQWGTRGWWAMLDQLAILKELFSYCSHLPDLILKVSPDLQLGRSG